MRGVGTQQLEQVLAERYPEARVARMDLDTTSTKWSHQRILGAVERGEVDLLIGTQMIAKGLDFPNVTLVGVVDADTGLYLPDFRAAERTFQLLAQVAGRAGRGPKGGRVIVQTRHPQHHALIWSARHDAEGFLREELDLRRAPPYPPERPPGEPGGLGRGRSGSPANRAAELADWCNALVARHALEVTVLGPAPVPAGADQGPVALARAAEGATGGAGQDCALRGAAAAEGGKDADRDRSGSGVAAVRTVIPKGCHPERLSSRAQRGILPGEQDPSLRSG